LPSMLLSTCIYMRLAIRNMLPPMLLSTCTETSYSCIISVAVLSWRYICLLLPLYMC
jgi:hypothetical protein